MLKEQHKKNLEKYYWNNKQMFEVSTIEVMDKEKGRDNYFSIYTIKDGRLKDYLFDIRNYNSFWDIERAGNDSCYSKFDSCGASCSIYYNARENLFTLPKFENITEEDIVKATKYLMRNHYDCWLIFNVKFMEPKDDDTRFDFKPNRIKRFFRKLTGQI